MLESEYEYAYFTKDRFMYITFNDDDDDSNNNIDNDNDNNNNNYINNLNCLLQIVTKENNSQNKYLHKIVYNEHIRHSGKQLRLREWAKKSPIHKAHILYNRQLNIYTQTYEGIMP